MFLGLSPPSWPLPSPPCKPVSPSWPLKREVDDTSVSSHSPPLCCLHVRQSEWPPESIERGRTPVVSPAPANVSAGGPPPASLTKGGSLGCERRRRPSSPALPRSPPLLPLPQLSSSPDSPHSTPLPAARESINSNCYINYVMCFPHFPLSALDDALIYCTPRVQGDKCGCKKNNVGL